MIWPSSAEVWRCLRQVQRSVRARWRGAGEFDAGGEDGGVEVEDGAELDLDAELDGGGGEGLAVEDPASAVGEGVGEERQDGGALFVAEGLEVDGLHCAAVHEGWLVLRVFIGAGTWGITKVAGWCARGSHD